MIRLLIIICGLAALFVLAGCGGPNDLVYATSHEAAKKACEQANQSVVRVGETRWRQSTSVTAWCTGSVTIKLELAAQ